MSITNPWSSLKLMSIKSVMPSSHLILCHPLLLPLIPPSIRVLSNESALRMRWPEYGSFSLSISPSNSKIVSSIRGISSAQGKYKAFSTCASHLSVVSLFYCTCLGVYLVSAASHNSHSSATASVMNTLVTSISFIYSLRNKDIKRVLRRINEMAVL